MIKDAQTEKVEHVPLQQEVPVTPAFEKAERKKVNFTEILRLAKVSFAEGEAGICKTIVDVFFASTCKVDSICQLELSDNSLNKQSDNLKNANKYFYVTKFVQKYGNSYSEDDLFKLKELLNLQDFCFNEDQVKKIITEEEREQGYLNFKKMAFPYSSKSLHDYTKAFAKIFYKDFTALKDKGEDIKRLSDDFMDPLDVVLFDIEKIIDQVIAVTHKIYFLKRLLLESKIELKDKDDKEVNNEELTKMIIDAKNGYELEKFEERLLKDKTYSIEDVDLMSGYEFEAFLKTLFKKMGYSVEQTKLSGDQGADLIVNKLGETLVIQAKRSNSKIGNKAIQEVVASINHYNAQRGMVITNNEFTPAAIELAHSNKIELVDRIELKNLFKEYF